MHRTEQQTAGTSKRARTQSRQQREARAAAARRVKRRNRILGVSGGLVIVGLVAAIAVSLVNAAGHRKAADAPAAATTTGAATVAPLGATDDGAIVVGKPAAPVTVEVYLDFMCPYCGRFEQSNSGEIQRLVDDGTVRLKLYPLAFLDRASSGTRYSTRAANALATVADRAPDRVLAFTAALYAHQPKEGSSGLSDDEIGALAAGAGVPAEVVGRFGAATFQPWIAEHTAAALNGKITGTPTVLINGKAYTADLYSTGPLTRAITAAAGR